MTFSTHLILSNEIMQRPFLLAISQAFHEGFVEVVNGGPVTRSLHHCDTRGLSCCVCPHQQWGPFPLRTKFCRQILTTWLQTGIKARQEKEASFTHDYCGIYGFSQRKSLSPLPDTFSQKACSKCFILFVVSILNLLLSCQSLFSLFHFHNRVRAGLKQVINIKFNLKIS